MTYYHWLGHESGAAEREEAERQQSIIDEARASEMAMRALAEDIGE